MKILLSFLSIICCSLSFAEQNAFDTTRISVDLTQFQLSKKVVIAEYGKVRMFFNQQDYSALVSIDDTVTITPKYFNKDPISSLLQQGKVMLIQRSDQQKQTELIHYLKRVGSMMFREFELTNGVHFFSQLEIIGIIDEHSWWRNMKFDFSDTIKKKPERCAYKTEDFAYPEVFADKGNTKSVKIQDYFPLKAGLHLVYSNNNGFGELDTITCKSTILDDQEVFYFAEKSYQNSLVSIGSTMFGDGLYYYQNDSLFERKVDFESDIHLEKDDLGFYTHAPEEVKLLLPPTLTTKDSFIQESDWITKSFIYLKTETVTVTPSKKKSEKLIYDDCIKIKIISHHSNSVYIEYVWLKRGVGLVKWMRPSGRIDELVNYY